MSYLSNINDSRLLKRGIATLSFILALCLITACDQKQQDQTSLEEEASPAKIVQASSAAPAQSQLLVTQVMTASPYTYVEGEKDGTRVWMASNQFEVKVGDIVEYPDGPVMSNFHSKTLDRTFEQIIFTDHISVVTGGAGSAPQSATVAADTTASTLAAAAEVVSVEKAEAGYTIAELFARRQELSGQMVSVRGNVVKYNAEIMGKNWIHLHDGSGESGTDDLTVTTSDVANIGDTVLVSGILSTDMDFGAGYAYSLIMDEASVKVE